MAASSHGRHVVRARDALGFARWVEMTQRSLRAHTPAEWMGSSSVRLPRGEPRFRASMQERSSKDRECCRASPSRSLGWSSGAGTLPRPTRTRERHLEPPRPRTSSGTLRTRTRSGRTPGPAAASSGAGARPKILWTTVAHGGSPRSSESPAALELGQHRRARTRCDGSVQNSGVLAEVRCACAAASSAETKERALLFVPR